MSAPVGPHTLVRKARVTYGGGIDDEVVEGEAETFTGCMVYPRGDGSEASGRELTVIQGLTALIPSPEADVRPSDVLTWRGKDYEVVGEPGPWYHLDGAPACLQVTLQKATG